jgi:hypothetical protein
LHAASSAAPQLTPPDSDGIAARERESAMYKGFGTMVVVVLGGAAILACVALEWQFAKALFGV